MKTLASLISHAAKLLLLAFLLMSPGKTVAQSLLYQFDTPFPSDPSPDGLAPWLIAKFQTQSLGTVLLTITAEQFSTSEFVGGNGSGANGGIFFNLNTNMNSANLTFTLQSSSAGLTAPTISTGNNSYKADGDGFYDIRFDFATSGSGRFTNSDTISYLITGIPNLTATDFGYLSAPGGGSGPFYAAAHIMALSNGNSTWIEPSQLTIIPVPEPNTLILASLSGVGILLLRRRK